MLVGNVEEGISGFFFKGEKGVRGRTVTGVKACALANCAGEKLKEEVQTVANERVSANKGWERVGGGGVK